MLSTNGWFLLPFTGFTREAVVQIEQVLSDIEHFFVKAAALETLKASYPDDLEPADEAEIESFAKGHSLAIPADIRRFWRRGLKYRPLTLKGDDSFAAAGFDWLSIKNITRDLPMFRGLAAPYPMGGERSLLQNGIPLTYSEPQLVWTPDGGISHFSTRNDLKPPVAESLTQFLEHWLEAGCFCSHNLAEYYPKVRHLVPGRIRPEENLWMRYYQNVFG
jgi:hypothetical protein